MYTICTASGGGWQTYTLVEECYMHDFMHGEMLDKR